MTDQVLEQLMAGLRAGRPDFSVEPREARRNFEALLATIPVGPEFNCEPEVLAGVPGLRITSAGVRSDAALLYLHGGAFVAGSARGYRGLAARLGRAAGLATHAIDYRLAPEHPFPAAVEDCVSAYRAILERVGDARRVALAGDSAGGGLTLSTLVALRDLGIALPAAGVMISPWVDLRCNAASYEDKAQADPSLTAEGLRLSAAHYLAGKDPGTALASPVHANLAGLPPLLIQVGSAEVLLDDAVHAARAAGAAGTDVQLRIWPDMVHVWHAFSFMLPAGAAAIAEAGEFMRRLVGSP